MWKKETAQQYNTVIRDNLSVALKNACPIFLYEAHEGAVHESVAIREVCGFSREARSRAVNGTHTRAIRTSMNYSFVYLRTRVWFFFFFLFA